MDTFEIVDDHKADAERLLTTLTSIKQSIAAWFAAHVSGGNPDIEAYESNKHVWTSPLGGKLMDSSVYVLTVVLRGPMSRRAQDRFMQWARAFFDCYILKFKNNGTVTFRLRCIEQARPRTKV